MVRLVFNYPEDEDVARFVEAGNILTGAIVDRSGGLALIHIGNKEIEAISDLPAGKNVTVCLRHEDITLSLPAQSPETTSARNRLSGKVIRIFPTSSQVRITIDVGFPLVALITRRSWYEIGLEAGREVTATFKASSIHLIGHFLCKSTAYLA